MTDTPEPTLAEQMWNDARDTARKIHEAMRGCGYFDVRVVAEIVVAYSERVVQARDEHAIAELTKERDAALVELTEARKEIERLTQERADLWADAENDAREIISLRAGITPPPRTPVSEDAMEAARAFAKRITAPRVGEDFIDALADMIARALTAAREAERERYRPLVAAVRALGAAMDDCEDCNAEFRTLWLTLATLDAATPEDTP